MTAWAVLIVAGLNTLHDWLVRKLEPEPTDEQRQIVRMSVIGLIRRLR